MVKPINDYTSSYQPRRINQLVSKVKLGCAVTGIAALVIGAALGPHLDRDTYTITVTDKDRIATGSGEDRESKYLVFGELENGKTKVFENTDSFIEFKFNSSDYQGKLKTGQTYEIKTYGWRIPIFSQYENIVDVKPVNDVK